MKPFLVRAAATPRNLEIASQMQQCSSLQQELLVAFAETPRPTYWQRVKVIFVLRRLDKTLFRLINSLEQ